MGRERECHAEGERFGAAAAALGDDAGKRARRDQRVAEIAGRCCRKRIIELRRHRDRVAVEPEHEGRQ